MGLRSRERDGNRLKQKKHPKRIEIVIRGENRCSRCGAVLDSRDAERR